MTQRIIARSFGPMSESRRLTTKRDAAEYADVSLRTIYRWISAGHLTEYSSQVGRSRVDLDEIDRVTRLEASA